LPGFFLPEIRIKEEYVMLDTNLKTQLKAYLEKVVRPFEIVASLDTSGKSRELQSLLQEIAGLCGKITLREDGDDTRRPSFRLQRADAEMHLQFAGIPMGHEFTSLILALLQTGGHPPKLSDEKISQIRAIEGEFLFETYFSLSCQNCPDVVQALNVMAILNPHIKHIAIDGALFQQEVDTRQVMSVPSIYLNGQLFAQGRMGVDEILAKIDTGSATREAAKLNTKEPFEVLIVGGGPAGAAAAIYAARKGIRTGVAAERFGGQVLDTMSIENFISVQETEGPRLARELEEHVKHYDVDIMNLQRASALVPAAEPGGYHEVRFASGASLKARSVILATGARWRELNVTGEQQYRNKGVAYCPHCDGPLYKGKRVAVAGGGNSGIEAAIDLAGIVKHVTVLEFSDTLRADEVLQRKLRSLPNVDIITMAQTTEILGDGQKMTGLQYKDRRTDEVHSLTLDGIFVQIGLLPNSEWIKGTVTTTRHGEIEIDAKGQTNIPGVFAAGDVTNIPFKQIIIAMGDGSRSALSAFDYLIRN
jgi:alkyl hydroperoxide reductase subunit F